MELAAIQIILFGAIIFVYMAEEFNKWHLYKLLWCCFVGSNRDGKYTP